MKITSTRLTGLIITILISSFLCSSCKKNDDMSSTGGEIEWFGGIDSTEIEEYKGDIGIRINLRPILRKGYQATTVKFDIESSEGEYDRLVEVDPLIGIAELIIPVETLSAAQEAELRDGVPFEVEILDANQNIIYTESVSIISFQENKAPYDLNDSNLPYRDEEVSFRADMPHFIQVLDANGMASPCPNSRAYLIGKPLSAGSSNTLLFEECSDFGDGRINQQYYFHKFPNEENVFAIYSRETNRYLAYDANDNTLRQSGFLSHPYGIDDGTLAYNYKFIISKEQNGLYVIKRYDNGVSMKREFNGFSYYWRGIPSGTVEYFRIIAYNTDYEIEQLETKQLAPILPGAKTSFGFNNTLVNCGSGELSQEVGTEKTFTTTQTSWFQETIGMSSRLTLNASVTVGAKAEASFFGNGGEVSGSVTAGVEVSVGATQESTTGTEFTDEISERFFSTRKVTVPPGAASLVYDARQTYSNVRLPFAQRLRLRGREVDPLAGNAIIGPLFGTDLVTQLRMANFKGLITFVGSDYVEITILGNTLLNNFVETKSEVKDVNPECG